MRFMFLWCESKSKNERNYESKSKSNRGFPSGMTKEKSDSTSKKNSNDKGERQGFFASLRMTGVYADSKFYTGASWGVIDLVEAGGELVESGELGFDPTLAVAEFLGHDAGDERGRTLGGAGVEEQGAGSAGEDVLDGAGHLFADGVKDLGDGIRKGLVQEGGVGWIVRGELADD
jgi:hypothetical protein